MKFSKKILPMVLAMAMVPAMSMPAFADDTNTTTSTVIAPTNNVDLSKHTFEAYQIFKGDLDGKKLSNITWGEGVDSVRLLKALKELNGTGKFADFSNCEVAADVVKVVAGFQNKSEEANKFAKLVANYLTSTKTTGKTEGVATLPEAGYYLIKDTTVVSGGVDDALNLSLLKVNAAGDVTVENKTSKTTLIKKVKDVNDSVGGLTEWQDSADYDIGDHIPYQLTATLGDLTNYDTYKLVFYDTMENLTLDPVAEGDDSSHALTVFVGEKKLDTNDYILEKSTDSKSFTVTINDVKILGGVTGTKVYVNYYAILGDDANIGSKGNPNTSYLEYSNNPNNTGEGGSLGKTPDDKNIVFTYKVVANKVDEKKTPLKGAAFELLKKDSSKTAPNNYNSVGIIGASKNADGTYEQTDDQKDMTKFEFKGIDDGDYKIVEVVTPKGYNTMAPIEFTVTAEHDILADNPQLRNLLGGDIFTGSVEGENDGAVIGQIVNKSGSLLPSTGGIGTTIFYIVGVVLVLGAGVLLVTKKRMNADK
ncbi:SpaA isopeptide-forming pilin-related protein [Blautia difficilis]|uniref:LPXTG cell wall anchor domain-containing protein n=1 Tax=Blautia difficilis TaxID=2763027 RepID=A0ABR7IDV7_9FIRM|nr:SpaA isopeptide-forming pilin-related protein [Blautia difficilis]MBC5778179.1 LPXTG cell wall anchor domain-containing protein [Blautia difficilis]